MSLSPYDRTGTRPTKTGLRLVIIVQNLFLIGTRMTPDRMGLNHCILSRRENLTKTALTTRGRSLERAWLTWKISVI